MFNIGPTELILILGAALIILILQAIENTEKITVKYDDEPYL